MHFLRCRIVRYEDLVHDLDGQIPKLLSSLGLPIQSSSVRNLISSAAVQEDSILVGAGAKNKRNPIEAMNRWKFSLPFNEVVQVQNACKQALNVWQYKELQSEIDLPQFDFVGRLQAFD